MQKRLEGKRIVFTGRLASMPRAGAVQLVRQHGGFCDRSVSRKTTTLVVGQEGWPLKKDGSLSNKLVAAKRLEARGIRLTVQAEEEWLKDLGLNEQSEGIHRRFTSAQLGRLLRIPRQRLAAWVRDGIVAPVETIDGVHFFDFHQMATLRTLWEMTQAGVGHVQLRKSFERLGRWLPSLGSSTPLALLGTGGEILVRLDQGIADTTGQLHFDFEDEGNSTISAASEPTADDWHHRGIECESAGDLQNAAAAYRKALLTGGPTPETAFNLGNVLYAMGQIGRAAERFSQAVEIDTEFVEAWNNLGNALSDLDDHAGAVEAFREALRIAPDYADSHYNLAETLSAFGRPDESEMHWRTYLRLEPIGEWAAYARRQLGNA